MLLQMNINNFALIERLSLTFHEGFNVLTGETGAGKSILIDAINYVLGSKFNRELIRTGEERTYVEAIFTIDNKKTKLFLNNLEIPNDELLVVSRESFQNGKTIAKINNKTVVLSTLKEVSTTLLDIHGQHENQNLLDKENHLYYLDTFGGKNIENTYSTYAATYEDLKIIDKKIDDLMGNEDRENIINYMQYQIKDIINGNFVSGEEEVLKERFNILNNGEKIAHSLNDAYKILYDSDEDNTSIYDGVSYAIKDLRAIEKHTEKLKDITDQLENFYFNLQDIIGNIREIKDSITYDENELEKTNSRIYLIDSYKKRYGKNSVDELLDYKDQLKKQYDEMINREDIIKQLEIEKSKVENKLDGIAKVLHDKRVEFSKILIEKTQNELNYIGLDKSKFHIEVKLEEGFKESGKDKIQFLISTNPGEPLKPLDRIVSGGELSRIMLAIKTVFADKDEIPTVIFDEIDTGISGRVAQSVAEKMYVISLKHQVFCVTHLPQIAAMSDHHFKVIKEVVENKTFTKVENLSMSQKEEEIARMIGGVKITKVTLENSKELISLAQNKKNNLKLI